MLIKNRCNCRKLNNNNDFLVGRSGFEPLKTKVDGFTVQNYSLKFTKFTIDLTQLFDTTFNYFFVLKC